MLVSQHPLHPSPDPDPSLISYRYKTQTVEDGAGLDLSMTDTDVLFEILGSVVVDDYAWVVTSSDTSVFTVSNGQAVSNKYLVPVSTGTATLTVSIGNYTYATFTVTVSANTSITFAEASGFDSTTNTLTIDANSTSAPVIMSANSATIGEDSVLSNLVWTIADTSAAAFGGGQATNSGPSAPIFGTGTEGNTTIAITAVVDGTTYNMATINVISAVAEG